MRSTRLRGGPIDDLLLALADEACRSALRYFQSSERVVATMDELVEWMLERRGPTADRETVRIRMHHSTLPKLADGGFIDYDARSGTVRYRERPDVERLLTLVAELTVDAG